MNKTLSFEVDEKKFVLVNIFCAVCYSVLLIAGKCMSPQIEERRKVKKKLCPYIWILYAQCIFYSFVTFELQLRAHTIVPMHTHNHVVFAFVVGNFGNMRPCLLYDWRHLCVTPGVDALQFGHFFRTLCCNCSYFESFLRDRLQWERLCVQIFPKKCTHALRSFRFPGHNAIEINVIEFIISNGLVRKDQTTFKIDSWFHVQSMLSAFRQISKQSELLQ